MSDLKNQPGKPGRRAFFTQAAVSAAAAMASSTGLAAPLSKSAQATEVEPFWGTHQGGIVTPMQRQTYFVAFDLDTTKREEVIGLLQAWTAEAARLCTGARQISAHDNPTATAADTGDTMGLSASRLTITFGFGAGLFEKDGQDRYGLARLRPAALADLPKFPGDQLVVEHSGGDISVQACADDPQVTLHAVRQLMRLADGIAHIRWVQTGFTGDFKAGETPRNLMGFKDGTINVATHKPAALKQFVWADEAGPAWMRNGSYSVVRKIRIALEHWDRMKLGFQEETFGRHKFSGAPIGGQHEFEPLDLKANDKDGNPIIAENAHARLAAPESNGGAEILRRSYSYNNGVSFVAERWPPWRQGLELDAGLLFQCYQCDPRTGFSKIFEKMARFDMMNQFTTHIGSGLFACPPGAQPGQYVGQALFEA
jgi:deferrochelatase/peroxidase EfeB